MALPASLPLPSYLQHPPSSPLQPLPLSPSLLQLPSPFHLPIPITASFLLLAPLLLLCGRHTSLSPGLFFCSFFHSFSFCFANAAAFGFGAFIFRSLFLFILFLFLTPLSLLRLFLSSCFGGYFSYFRSFFLFCCAMLSLCDRCCFISPGSSVRYSVHFLFCCAAFAFATAAALPFPLQILLLFLLFLFC